MKYIGENAIKKLISLIKSDIKKKLDKNQGTANSGKILGVNATGEVAPTDTEVATLVDVPNGIVKGDGSTLSAAVAGTDYVTPDGMNSAVAEAKPFIVTMTINGSTYTTDKTVTEIKAAHDAGRICILSSGPEAVTLVTVNNEEAVFSGATAASNTIVVTVTVTDGNSATITLIDCQNKITASGLLKSDGNGGVSAATAGSDYMAPVTGGTAGQVLTKTADSQQWADAPKSLPDGGTTGDALVKSADGGSWETPVEASLVDLPVITASQTDLTAGTSPLATGELYVVYE